MTSDQKYVAEALREAILVLRDRYGMKEDDRIMLLLRDALNLIGGRQPFTVAEMQKIREDARMAK